MTDPSLRATPPPQPPTTTWRRDVLRFRVQQSPDRDTRTLLSFFGGTGLAVGCIGLAAHYVPSTRPLVLGIAAMSPVLMSATVIGLVLLALARRWHATAGAALVLVFVLVGQSPLYVATPSPRDGRDLVVMTANLGLGEAEPHDVVAAVRRDHVEILMVQELTRYEVQRLAAAGLKQVMPYQVAAPGGGASGSGLWSRYPLTQGRLIPGFSFSTVAARVSVPGARLQPTLLSVHMAGPVPESGDWSRDITRLPATLFDQPEQAPVIVGGDFNATFDTPQFRAALVDGFHDVAEQAGTGYPRTWPANRGYPPLIAIDHVLTRDAVGLSADTVEIRGTDHRALLTKVRVSD